MKISLKRKISLSLLLGFIILIVTGYTSYTTNSALITYSEERNKSNEIISHLDNLLKLMLDAETGVRGYYLTSDTTYLEPYNNALGKIDAEKKYLGIPANVRENDLREFAILDSIVLLRTAVLNSAVINKKNGNTDNLLNTTAGKNRGKELMDEIRNIIDRMKRNEETIKENYNILAHQSADRIKIIIPAGSAAAIIIIILASIFINKEINERGIAEECLKFSEIRLRAIMDNSPVVMTMKDTDGRYMMVNLKAEKVLNRTSGEMKGKTVYDFHPVEEAKILDSNDRKVRETGMSTEYEENIILNGSVHVFSSIKFPLYNSDGNIYATCGISSDITERKRSEEMLRESEERYRLIVEKVHDYGIFMLDTQGNIASWNKGAEKIKGYKANEIVGRHFSVFYPEEDVKKGKPEFELKQAAEAGSIEDEGIRLRKDGSSFWANVVITALYDESGKLRGFTKVTRDITEKKNAMENLIILNRQLEEGNKELGAFSYSVSHDLRAPLRHIIGFSEKLNRKLNGSLDDDSHRYLKIIIESTGKMGNLIDELLTYSKIGKEELIKKENNLEKIVKDIANATDADLEMAGIGNKIEWKITNIPTAYCGLSGIEMVLTNLISNAVKYSSKNPKPVIEIGGSVNAFENEYYIKDNGVGFDMKYADKLYGVFQRLHREEEFSGTGIGLATVRRIITKHGGRTWAEAEPEKGAVFYFTLPKKIT